MNCLMIPLTANKVVANGLIIVGLYPTDLQLCTRVARVSSDFIDSPFILFAVGVIASFYGDLWSTWRSVAE